MEEGSRVQEQESQPRLTIQTDADAMLSLALGRRWLPRGFVRRGFRNPATRIARFAAYRAQLLTYSANRRILK